jgi:ABC-type branched-subunit amino acid transport system substrate-binding protein
VRARFLDDTAERRFAGTSIGGAPSPVKAAENARRATEDSTAIAYIGELTSGGTRASLPVTNEAMLLHVSPGAGATDLVAEFAGSDEVPPTQPSGERNFGRVVPSDFAQGEAAARWAKQLGWRWVGIVDDGTAFGATLASGFEEEAAELGIAVGSEDAPRLFLTGRERAGDTPAIASDSFLPPYRFGLPSPVRVISAALDPVHLPPRGRELAARFEAEYGRRPGRYAAYGYEAMAVILDSIERAADPADRSAVIDAFFETASRDSVLGRYSISEIGETTLARMTGYLPGEEGRPRPVAELTAGP